MPTDELHVAVNSEADRTRVVVSGELDAHTAQLLSRPLMDLASAEGTRIDVDMSGVTFLDSSGLRVLIVAQKQSAQLGGSLVLHGSSPAVERILEAAGLQDFFTRA